MTTQAESPRSATAIRCKRCGHRNVAIDIWCANCGNNLDFFGEPVAAQEPKKVRGARAKSPARPVLKPLSARLAGGMAALGSRLQRTGGTLGERLSPARARPAQDDPPKVAPPAPQPVSVAAKPPAPPPAAAGPAAPKTETAAPAWLHCSQCGRANSASDAYCPRCGKQQAGAPPRQRGSAGSRSRPLPVWVAVLAGLVVIAVIGLAFGPAALRNPGTTRAAAARLPQGGGAPVAGQTGLPVAIPALEQKTGLRYAAGGCGTSRCLTAAHEADGLDGAVVLVNAGAGRECAAYLAQGSSRWRVLSTACAPAGQLSPLVGRSATVHVSGGCANVRDAATLTGGVVACLNDGTGVSIDAGPTFADGKLWWHLQKNGWMAQEFLQSGA